MGQGGWSTGPFPAYPRPGVEYDHEQGPQLGRRIDTAWSYIQAHPDVGRSLVKTWTRYEKEELGAVTNRGTRFGTTETPLGSCVVPARRCAH